MNRRAALFLLLASVASAAAADVAAPDLVAPPPAATVFATHLQPFFEDYCVQCHGPEKTKGKLRLDSFENLKKGGEGGSAFQAGDSAHSPLVERLSLPAEDEDHMPPAEKPQPEPDLIKLVAWWIDQGANPEARTADLKIPADLTRLFAPREILRPRSRPDVEAALTTGVAPAKFTVSFVALDTAGLRVSSSRAGDEDVERLLALRENITDLDLARAPVTDRALAAIGRMTNLQSLRLDGTAITDAGVSLLAPLQQLQYLNLNRTSLTDRALESLRRIKALRKIYLADTAVTAEAARTLHSALYPATTAERLRKQIATLEHARDALRVEVFANPAAEPAAAEAEAPPAMTISTIMKSIHEGKNSKAVLAPEGKLSDDDLNQMLELYTLMAAMRPPKGEPAHFQELTRNLITATKGLLAKTPGADDEYRQAADCKACHAQHRSK